MTATEEGYSDWEGWFCILRPSIWAQPCRSLLRLLLGQSRAARAARLSTVAGSSSSSSSRCTCPALAAHGVALYTHAGMLGRVMLYLREWVGERGNADALAGLGGGGG